MTSFNDSEDTFSTISDVSSVHGTNAISEKEKDDIIREQREEIERLRKAQNIPTWVTSETKAVDQSWDAFRKTFERVKERIVQYKSMEDMSGSYRDMKKSSETTNELICAWIKTADAMKNQLDKFNQILMGYCKLNDETNELSLDFEKDKENSSISTKQDSVMWTIDDKVGTQIDTEIYPSLSEQDKKQCENFVGTMHRSPQAIKVTEYGCCMPEELPLKISIKKLKNDFYQESRHYEDGKVTEFKWRPDKMKRHGSACGFYNKSLTHTLQENTYSEYLAFQFELVPLRNVVTVTVARNCESIEHEYFISTN